MSPRVASLLLVLLGAAAPAAAQYDRVTPAAPARQVSLSFYINSLRAVDSVNETFEVDYYLLIVWDDPAVQTVPADWSTIWNPKIDSINAVTPGKLWEDYRLLGPGRIYSIARYATTYRAPMDLRRFPFDRQVLPLVFESSTYRLQELAFRYEVKPGVSIRVDGPPLPVAKKLALSPDIHIPEWAIENVQVRQGVNRYAFDNDSAWSQFRVELVLSRNYGFYFWRVFAIQAVIVILSWLVFVHEPADLGSRMSFSLTLFLAAVAFSFVITGLIPHISYLTFLDAFMLVSYGLIFLTAIVNAAVYWLDRRTPGSPAACRINRWAAVGFPLAFLIYVVQLAILAQGR
jgi:hypothetical protein